MNGDERNPIDEDWVGKVIERTKKLAETNNPLAMELFSSGADHNVDPEFKRIFDIAEKTEGAGVLTFMSWIPSDLKKDLMTRLGIHQNRLKIIPTFRQNYFVFSETNLPNVVYANFAWRDEGTGGDKAYLLFNLGIKNAEDLRKLI